MSKKSYKTANEILLETAVLVQNERAKQNGDKHKTFNHIAKMWNAYISMKQDKQLNSVDVAQMMILFKIVRNEFSEIHNLDNFADSAGYAACGGEIADFLNADIAKAFPPILPIKGSDMLINDKRQKAN